VPGAFDTNEQPTLIALRPADGSPRRAAIGTDAPASPSQGDPRLSTVVDDRFRLTRVLGEGAMGVVYEAIQLSADRPVAIKMVRPEPGGEPGFEDDGFRRRLLRELRLLTQLNHPNVVHVLDGGVTDAGAVFFVMERLAGVTLHDRLATGALAWRHACELAIQLCDALTALHDRGIVHRDLKPGNIMLVDEPVRGELVKVLDFGIAKAVPHAPAAERASQLTLAGALIGTPHYMSPEAIDGMLDPRIDLYALGCILHEMLAGASPFADAATDAVLWHQLSAPPPSLPAEIPAAHAARGAARHAPRPPRSSAPRASRSPRRRRLSPWRRRRRASGGRAWSSRSPCCSA
jgi:serine/threonine protein kinase